VESVLTLEGNNKSGYYSFRFQSQPDSNNQDYYAKLVVLEDTKDIKIGSGPGDAYLDGALYKNDQPRNEQLTFRLSYDLTQMIIGLGQLAIIWLLYSIIGIFLYILPGWAWQQSGNISAAAGFK